MKGVDLLYELGRNEKNDVIYTLDEWRQIHAEFDKLEAENKTLRAKLTAVECAECRNAMLDCECDTGG